MEHTAVVVGGGIAGLASALALAQQGWRTTVAEQAAELGEIGAGFAMTRNAAAAFRGLGFDDDDLGRVGCATWAAGTWDSHGRPILQIPDDGSATIHGAHRARVHHALLDRALAAGVEVRTGVRVTAVEPGTPDGAPATVDVGDHRLAADLVVGADGARSAVRAALFGARRLRYSGYSSWRAIVPGPAEDDGLHQYWGAHAEFGILQVSTDETYWYGYVRMPERSGLPDELEAARHRFAGWAPPVQHVLERTAPDAVMRHDVHHLPGGLPRYTTGRVVMVGDAAHVTLPTMGQGVATALEDGLCVGLLVGRPVQAGERLGAALTAFDAARRPRCRSIGRAAVLSGRFGAHLGPRWQGLRNGLMRRVPAAVTRRGADAVMGWTPPS